MLRVFTKLPILAHWRQGSGTPWLLGRRGLRSMWQSHRQPGWLSFHMRTIVRLKRRRKRTDDTRQWIFIGVQIFKVVKCVPEKNRTLKQWNAASKFWGVWLLSYIFHEAWLICFWMIHCWNSSSHASLISNVFKIECQNPFVPLYGRQVNGYNRNPMWPSLG